jgi:hypothetical protein
MDEQLIQVGRGVPFQPAVINRQGREVRHKGTKGFNYSFVRRVHFFAWLKNVKGCCRFYSTPVRRVRMNAINAVLPHADIVVSLSGRNKPNSFLFQ